MIEIVPETKDLAAFVHSFRAARLGANPSYIEMKSPIEPSPAYHPPPPRGFRALSTLRRGGLVLLPTANLWQLVADARQPETVRRMLSICPPSTQNRPELIFPDRETLLEWCPELHPKLDGLLIYHRRALTVLTPATPPIPASFVDERGEVAVRLALDSFCYRLCEDQEAPLAATLALGAGASDLPTRFGRIRSDVLRAADHTLQRRQTEELDTLPAVRVRLEGDELEFI